MEFLARSENVGQLSESVLCDHIIRLAFALNPQGHGFEPMTSVFYWRSKKDREIDFAIRTNKALVPVECKCQEDPQPDDMFAIAKFNSLVKGKYGIIASKSLLDVKRDAVLIPLPVFLLLV